MKSARSHASRSSADQLSFAFSVAPTPQAAPSTPTKPIRTIADLPKKAERRPRPAQAAVAVFDEPRQLTVDDAASLLSVSVKTLEAWRRLGKGPAFVKLGRSVRYTMRAIDQFTSDRTVRNSAEGRMLDARK